MQFDSLGSMTAKERSYAAQWNADDFFLKEDILLMISSWRKIFCLISEAETKEKLKIQVITGLLV